MKKFIRLPAFLFLLMIPMLAFAQQNYNPLQIDELFKPQSADLTVHDGKRDRDIPVKIYLPAAKTPAPVILFSHGLGGSRNGNEYLADQWSARGYVCVFIQHPGSDESLWKNKGRLKGYLALKKAVNAGNFMQRVKDISAVIDKLEEWNASQDNDLNGRLDLKNIGMSGHSFGAVTTQAVGGELFKKGELSFADKRIKAAVAMSPSAPKDEKEQAYAFDKVTIPWMIMTGTKDVAPIADQTVDLRLKVFPLLPPGDKYGIVLYNAEHSAFGDRSLPSDKEPRNPNHHKVILALSTAFFDSYLKHDQAAAEWLKGSGPLSVIEKDDSWKIK